MIQSSHWGPQGQWFSSSGIHASWNSHLNHPWSCWMHWSSLQLPLCHCSVSGHAFQSWNGEDGSEIAVVNPVTQRETWALHSEQMCPPGAPGAPYFPVACEISASFNHITASDQQPSRAEISLGFLMYINCPILSKHDCGEFSEKPEEPDALEGKEGRPK